MPNPTPPFQPGTRFSLMGHAWRVLSSPDSESILQDRAHPDDLIAKNESTGERRHFTHEFLTDAALVEELPPC